MKKADRVELVRSALERLIKEGRDTDSLILETNDAVGQVQFMLHGESIYGQVSWERDGLSFVSGGHEVQDHLAAIGFRPSPGGRYARAGIDPDPPAIADLAEELFNAINGGIADFVPRVNLALGGEGFEGALPVRRIGDEVLEMAADHLRRRDLRYFYSRDGILVQLDYDVSRGTALRILIQAAGERLGVLGIRIFSDQRFGRTQRAHVIDVCNRWNAEQKWPKVYLETPGDPDVPAAIVCELFIDLAPGVTQEMVDAWVQSAVVNTFGFWEWVQSGGRLSQTSRGQGSWVGPAQAETE